MTDKVYLFPEDAQDWYITLCTSPDSEFYVVLDDREVGMTRLLESLKFLNATAESKNIKIGVVNKLCMA